jgi:hypothetical protein
VTGREKATWKNFLIALSSSSLLLLHRVFIKWKHRLVDSGDDFAIQMFNILAIYNVKKLSKMLTFSFCKNVQPTIYVISFI